MSRVLESDDQGVLSIPPELLANAAPHQRYRADSRGDRLVVSPEPPEVLVPETADTRWFEDWKLLAQQFDETSITERSAVDLLSEMRR